MIEVDLFPVKCFLLEVSSPQEILNECLEKKESIKDVDFSNNLTWHKNHFTDYSSPVKIFSFENQIKEALTSFHKKTGLTVSLIEYWTAFYGEGAVHEPHVHNISIFDSINYSGVLYLTGQGGTSFFCNHGLSKETTATTDGKPGSAFLFPAALPHTFSKEGEGERVVMSFNLNIHGSI
jgi:hypothetical protein